MKNQKVDVAVIGGGPAGLAAAWSAKTYGANHVVVIDRNHWLGGILPQCIHDGFGVEETGVSMTGPEYAEKYIAMAQQIGVQCMTETMVLSVNRNHTIIAINKQGPHRISAKAVVFAMGCREKTRWNILTQGDRPSGIYTAGVAQGFMNLYNLMPARNVVIVGSGDVGLIMARRLKFEGANVLGVVEILPYATGLPRNVVQCLDDYGIPLFLNHTITGIYGKERLEKVTIAQVDTNFTPIPSTEKEVRCDTLLLSLGLIPENELSKALGITLDPATGGPVINQQYETSVPGFFACGNCLQVYDTVDLLSTDAKKAGKQAAKFIKHRGKSPSSQKNVQVQAGQKIRYVIPQHITEARIIRFSFRVHQPQHNATIVVKAGRQELKKQKFRYVNPANIITLEVAIPEQIITKQSTLEVVLQ